MPTAVTASMLYDLVMCPHRVTMDLYADPAKRDEPNPFVKMLWERGSLYEREVIAGLDVPFLDLSTYAGDEKERLTLEAMQRGEGHGGICEEAQGIGLAVAHLAETARYRSGALFAWRCTLSLAMPMPTTASA